MIATLSSWWRRSHPDAGQLGAALALALVTAATTLILLGGSGLLVVRATGPGGLVALGGLLVVIEVVAFVRAPLRFKERMSAHRVALRSMVAWRAWLFDVLALRSPGATGSLASGELLDRTIEDVDALQDLYVRLALPAMTCVVTGGLATLICVVILPMAGLLVGTALVLGIGVSWAVGARAARADLLDAAARGQVSARSADLLLGLTDLTMGGATEAFLEALDDAEHRRNRSVARRSDLRGLGTGVIAIISALCVVGVALATGSAHHRGVVTSGEAVALTLVALAGLEPLVGLLAAAIRAPEVAASGDRLDAIAALPLPVAEPAAPCPWPPGRGVIELEGLAAPALVGGPAVLRDVTLRIPPGAHVAILGASGSGKSTLCRVLMRFIAPTAGSLCVENTSLTAISSDEVREHIAMLDQSPSIFGGTLRDCLRLGDPTATDAELLSVLERCELSELAAPALGGLDRQVAEDGATFSGGQQRRLALARALLRYPEILVLDEPTAGLDAAQAADVLDTCLSAAGDASVVLVTHAVEETVGFDQVLWLEDGALRPLDDEQLESLRR
jgi:thiol reductant ABC exporter CydC subunit